MLRLLSAVLVLACAAPASAQSEYELFRPLHVGNEWVWSWVYEERRSFEDEIHRDQGYTSVRIVGETEIDGQPGRVAECVGLDETGTQVLAFSRLAVPVAEGPVVPLEGAASLCSSMFSGWATTDGAPFNHPSEMEGDVEIGSELYYMDHIDRRYSFSGGPGLRNVRLYLWADRVGHYFFESDYGHDWPGNAYTYRSRTLEFAIVNGEVFGSASPVAAEEASAEVEQAALRAYPSPASTDVTLAGAAGAVAVFDLLGRRVARVEAAPGQPFRLDVSAWPAGLYVARALTGDGPQTARFVVAR